MTNREDQRGQRIGRPGVFRSRAISMLTSVIRAINHFAISMRTAISVNRDDTDISSRDQSSFRGVA